jgi:hypothetical protein
LTWIPTADAAAELQLTADKHQPGDAEGECAQLSEREDGANRG